METPFIDRKVYAGFPSPAADYLEKPINLHDYLVQNVPATFLARVAGDSMIGAGILPGDIVVLDRSITPVSGQTIVAMLDGGMLVKYWIDQAGKKLLRSANQHYPDLVITEQSDFLVWGVVTGVVRKL